MAVLVTVLAMIYFPAATSSLVYIRGLFYPSYLSAPSGCGELYYLTFQALRTGFTSSLAFTFFYAMAVLATALVMAYPPTTPSSSG